MNTVILNGQECVVITKDVLMELIQDKAVSMRESDRLGFSNVAECMKILGCGYTTFRKKVNARGSLIKAHSIKGKYITKSVEKERDRNN